MSDKDFDTVRAALLLRRPDDIEYETAAHLALAAHSRIKNERLRSRVAARRPGETDVSETDFDIVRAAIRRAAGYPEITTHVPEEAALARIQAENERLRVALKALSMESFATLRRLGAVLGEQP